MPKKQPKGRRLCLFCGGTSESRSSGEHLWPQWASSLLPKRATKQEFAYLGRNGFKDITEVRKDYTRQGSPASIKSRGSCKKCNETWMGKIEEDNIAVLSDFIRSSTTSINRKQMKSLEKWLFLKFCVTSCEEDVAWCISENERLEFMKTQVIPKRFSAWIFTHNSNDWYDRSLWLSTHACDPESDIRPDLNGPHNVNTFAFGFGRVLFFVFFSGIFL